MKTKKPAVFLSAVMICSAFLTGCKEQSNIYLSDTSDESSVTSTVSEDISEPADISADSSDSSSTTTSVTSQSSSTTQSDTSSTSSTSSSTSSTSSVHQHSFSLAKSAEPDCVEAGYKIYKCSCGEQYTETAGKALGHSYSKSVVAPTCTKGGYTTYTCSHCGDTYKDGTTSAMGHDWGEWKVTKNATASAEGVKKAECTRCDETKTASVEKLKGNSSYADEVVVLVNEEREKQGLPALTVRKDLSEYAQLRSTEIVDNFDHVRPDGSSPLKYVMSLSGVHTAGENIAWGQSTPVAVMTAWMNSPGHRANILSASFTSIGVGCYEYNGRLYWTQIFAG